MNMRKFLPALCAALLVACAGMPQKQPAAPATASTPPQSPADDNLNAVAWTQTAVEHDLILREIYRVAQEKLAAAVADRSWDALPHAERATDPKNLPPAVILDVDETVLDNSPYQARLIRDGGEYNEFTWAQWCKQADAKALPGAVTFTRYAAAHGVTVFYLSNRAKDLDAVTLANLRNAGFPVAGPDSFLGLGTFVKGCEQIGSEKGCRRKLIGERYRVLMQFGDQIGDFVDVLANTPAGRAAAVESYADWFGERWFVLPNPTYGSWEPALFNNDWTLSRDKRDAAKRSALRTD
jgi:acid phosphatase